MTMCAGDVLADLTDAGLAVRVDGGRLLVKPASKLTGTLLLKLRAAKAELLVLLAEPPRPYRLTPAESAVAHADPWDDATIARFVARVGLFLRRGFDATDADDLAERLHLRDVHADYRHLCLECAHYRPSRCGNHRAAGLNANEISRDLATMFQHCAGFNEEQP